MSRSAIGSVHFTTYIPHDLAEDLPIVRNKLNDFVLLYVEATTGLIKGTDGTNTAVSASAAVAGSQVSGSLTFKGETGKMWVTLDDVPGTIVDFEGYFPDTGERVFGMTAGTYQTLRNQSFSTT